MFLKRFRKHRGQPCKMVEGTYEYPEVLLESFIVMFEELPGLITGRSNPEILM
jgi:hypothetical protein